MTTLPRLALALIIALGAFTGCGDAAPRLTEPLDMTELLRKQQEERRREQQLQEQRKWTAKQYANAAGNQIMADIGGGQDLVVDVTGWSFNPVGREYEA